MEALDQPVEAAVCSVSTPAKLERISDQVKK